MRSEHKSMMEQQQRVLMGDFEIVDLCDVECFENVCVYDAASNVWIRYADALPTKLKQFDALAVELYDSDSVDHLVQLNSSESLPKHKWIGIISLLAVMWRLPGTPVSIDRCKRLLYEPQGSPNWIKRHPIEFLTSTRTAELCNATIYGNERTFWQFVMRLCPAPQFNDQSLQILNHGVIHEDLSRIQSEKMLNCKIESVGTFVDLSYPGIACNVDGVIRDPTTKEVLGIVEIKNPIHDEYFKLKFEHVIQMQQNMRITGAPWCYYIITHFPNDCQDIEYKSCLERGIDPQTKAPPSKISYEQYKRLWCEQNNQSFVPPHRKIGMISIVKLYASQIFQDWILERIFTWWNNYVCTYQEPPPSLEGQFGQHTHPELFEALDVEVPVYHRAFLVL